MSKPNADYVLPNNQPIVELDCRTAFNNLTKKEKLYAHYISRACWDGALIVLVQTSPESPLVFTLLHKIFVAETPSQLKSRVSEKVSDEEFTAFLVYACGIFTNSGNYKGFGDSKFVPNLPEEQFEYIVQNSKAYNEFPEEISSLWNKCRIPIFCLNENVKSLGYPDKAVTTYFSSNCTEEDVKYISDFLKKQHIEAYNTRVVKSTSNGKPVFEILFASVESGVANTPNGVSLEDGQFKLVKGDYSPLLQRVNENLEKARLYASNETEAQMLDKYIESFKTGSLQAHKDGSRLWIKDKGPIIETYIGFIETYRDPNGSRGEFEGFVAVVNKEMSKKFGELVNRAEELLELLPWPSAFEKDKFQKPDFTSLDVLTFSGSGIPCGINIPNYDDIRQNEGFKNVSLGNVIPSGFKDSPFPFLSAEDRQLLLKHAVQAFEVQVGLHELLGHGSGKLFHQLKDGSLDFDADSVTDPLSGQKVVSWYEEGETYDSMFTSMGSAYEECRAECVGLYLSLLPQVVRIFVPNEEDVEAVTYVNWLLLINNGVEKALEMYQPSNGAWLQAHSQARFVIMRVLLDAGEDLVTVVETEKDKKLRLSLNKQKLHTVGARAIKEFLIKLQVYKSTANINAAQELFKHYSSVLDEEPYPWLRWRNIVMAHKQPRKMFIQHNTFEKDDDVSLKSYETNIDGLIQSWVERFPKPEYIHAALIELADKDDQYFKYCQ